MRYLLSTFLFVFSFLNIWAQNPEQITIARDRWGVPHVFAATDKEASYGLAWAHAEDDFKTIQQSFLAGKSMLGLQTGKSGATIDYVTHLIRAKQLVNANYEKDISADFKAVLEGYCEGINAYAKEHPKEVLVKQLFPMSPKDLLSYSVLQLCVSAGLDQALKQIVDGTVSPLQNWQPGGSNAYAFNSKITSDGQTYLNINSHQPLEGPVAWYEAHVQSDEGWNMLGATFPGAPIILHGCNENLGWAHTVNSPDKLDVFQLQLNPVNNNQYKFDGKWVDLEEETVKLKVKIAGIVITVKKQIYWSKYGPTMKTKKGAFSIRTAALFDIRALEQWFRMNKSKNFTEFNSALNMEAIPGYNVVYADKFDTIFYISNAKLPVRNPHYNWRGTVPGDTSATLWTKYHPVSTLPQLLNPAHGYVFNSNNTPFNAAAPQDNLKASNFDANMGYELRDNNRSQRFMELMRENPTLSYEEFKKVKYDLTLPETLFYGVDANNLFKINAANHPELAEVISTLKQWNRKATADSKGAAIFALAYYYVTDQLSKDNYDFTQMNETACLATYQHIKEYTQKYFNGTIPVLGELQKLVRGKQSLALEGVPDVISSMESTPWENGRIKGRQGESYIELVRFTNDGPIIESVNCYGASNRPESPHYADQMELFTQQKTKPMTLNKKLVLEQAERIYHPK